MTKDERNSRREKMTIDIAFGFLRIVVIGEASKQKGVPLLIRVKKEAAGVEVEVAFSFFNSKSRCQSSRMLKFM